ncbi:SEC10/PgrA surface exclusion domain-containing protein [Leuconostoc pseudomesenteroides]|uniref:SEC10/PgrA surface exclusion domain-containing protein n=1 Tax=Leuconostoc pseudomesenteroides TaxID=33968 RepID=UPI0040351E80
MKHTHTGSKLFKSGKQLMTTAGATLAVATLSLASVPFASADSVTATNSDSTINTAQTTTTPSSQFDAAKVSEQAKLTALQAQQQAELAQKEADNQKALTQKDADLQKQQDNLPAKQADELATYDQTAAEQEATQKTNSEHAISDKEAQQTQTVTDAEKQSETDTANEQTKLDTDPAISAQAQRDAATKKKDDAVAQAETDKANETAQAEATKKADTDTADTKAANDEKAAEKTRDDKIADADYTVNNAESVADAKQAAADKDAKATQTTADSDSLAKKNSDTATAQSAHDNNSTVKANQQQVNASQADYDARQKVVDDIIAKTPYVATPSNNLTDSGVTYDEQNKIHQTENLPIELVEPKYNASQDNNAGKYDLYDDVLDKDTSEVVNGTLTAAQQQELADYALTLINSWRKSQGLDPIVWTQGTQDVTVANVNNRENSQIGFAHTNTNADALAYLKSESASNGLRYSGENMGVALKSNRITMNTLKVSILNTITNMIYFDASSGNLHRLNFHDAQYMGFAMQPDTNTKDSGYGFSYISIFDFYKSSDSQSVESKSAVLTPTFASTYRANVNPTAAQYQAASDAKDKLATDQATLASSVKANDADLATKLTTINATYTDEVQSHLATYNASVAQNKTTRDYEVNNAQTIRDDTVKTANSSYTTLSAKITSDHDATIKTINATYQTTMQSILDKYDAALSDAQATYDTEYEAAKDETEAERQARHEKLFEAFKANEAQKLQALKDQLADELVAFKANEAQKLTDLMAKHAQGRVALLAAQKVEVDQFPAYSASVLANFKAQLNNEYQNLVALKAKEMLQAEKDSQAYLDSIDPSKIVVKPSQDTQAGGNNSGQVVQLTHDLKGTYSSDSAAKYRVAKDLVATFNDKVTKKTQSGTSDLPKTSAQASSFVPGILALLLATVGLFFRKQKQEN